MDRSADGRSVERADPMRHSRAHSGGGGIGRACAVLLGERRSRRAIGPVDRLRRERARRRTCCRITCTRFGRCRREIRSIRCGGARSRRGFRWRCVGRVSPRPTAQGQVELRQPRFWEHHIRSAEDYAAHVRYCWTNPVKHGLCEAPEEWALSSVLGAMRQGVYPQGGVYPAGVATQASSSFSIS